MTPTGAIPIQRIDIVELHPDDTVIVYLPEDMTRDSLYEAVHWLRNEWSEQRVVCVSGDVRIEVHRPAETA